MLNEQDGDNRLKKIYYKINKLEKLIIVLIIIMVVNLKIIFNFNADNPLYSMRFFIYVPTFFIFVWVLLDRYLISYIGFNENEDAVFVKLFFSKQKKLVDLKKIKKIVIDHKKMKIGLYYDFKSEENVVFIPFKRMNQKDFECLIEFFQKNYVGNIEEINLEKDLIKSLTKPILILTAVVLVLFNLFTGLLALVLFNIL